MEQVLGKSSEDILSPPVRGGRSLTTAERRSIDLSSKIKGWGSDLDPAMRPGVPMDKAPFVGIEALYPDFEQQVPRGKVHKSVEHAKLTPVFGNACPPRGLSGLIRDYAYSFSEGKLAHWLLLVTADRVDMVEELLIDLAHFRVPNLPKEMGLTSELKYNRKGLAKQVAVVGVSIFALYVLQSTLKRRSTSAM
jgi:hypothetical protein